MQRRKLRHTASMRRGWRCAEPRWGRRSQIDGDPMPREIDCQRARIGANVDVIGKFEFEGADRVFKRPFTIDDGVRAAKALHAAVSGGKKMRSEQLANELVIRRSAGPPQGGAIDA
jgi:hypothetical protein